MVVAKKYILVKRSEGLPKPSDFKLVEEELPPLNQNEYLVEALFLSVDPYMRAYMPTIPIGSTMIGQQVAKIIESKARDFPVGKYVCGSFGWTTHAIGEAVDNINMRFRTILLPDLGDLPLSYGIGALGRPGNSAYFGFLELCQPKVGDTVLVSGAAGAVGNHVGQIAKIKGCKVIGIAGSEEKGKWLTNELGFDHFINYKTEDIEEALKKVAPQGVDCYFDNVGGEISTIVMNHMNVRGRVAVCGTISSYNATETPRVLTPSHAIVSKQLRLEGFLVNRWNNRWMEGIQQNLQWIKQGKLKYTETVTEGFSNMFKAFIDMLEGRNRGKAVVKV